MIPGFQREETGPFELATSGNDEFDRAIARSADKLARLAREALDEYRAGLTEELDPERL